MPESNIDVAVVGAGPVGLLAANLLGELGIACRLFEREASTSFHPRGHVINARSMEILRQIGLEKDVNNAALPIERHAGIGFVTSLAGDEIGTIRTRGDPVRDAREVAMSPVLKRSCPQDLLEPILQKHADTYPSVSMSFSTEVTGIEQHENGVDLTWLAADGRTGVTRAKYVIGADGPRSFVRNAVGLAMNGQSMGQQIGVYFHADLWPWVKDRPFLLWWIYNATTTGVIISMDGRYRWTFNFPYHDGESRHDYDEERCTKLICAAIGVADIELEIKSIMPWRMQARLAERLQSGRVFIAGDAAHPLPPTGGQGMNTGIAGVHNLVWKLNLVLKGRSPASFLETYSTERLPVAAFNVGQSVRNAEKMARSGLSGILALDPEISGKIEGPEGATVRKKLAEAVPEQREHFDYPGQTFGYSYVSGAIVPDGTPPPDFNIDAYMPTARPGHRAPHFWLSRGREKCSSIDLCTYTQFTLFAGPDAADWASAFGRATKAQGIAGTALHLPQSSEISVEDDAWLELCDISAAGAILVRPDGHVAWRAHGSLDDPDGVMKAALRKAVGIGQS